MGVGSSSFEHIYDSAIAVGDGASASRVSYSAGQLSPELRQRLDQLLDALAGQWDAADEAAQRAAGQLRAELVKKDPDVPRIRRLLAAIAAGVGGASTVVSLIDGVRQLLGH